MSNSENVGDVPTGFTSEMIATGGADIYCVHGGRGPALVLLHGFPEDWVEYKAIMPRLAKQFTVAAIDLPGVGRSSPSNRGYEATAIAQLVKEVVKALGFEKPYLVGHDLGGVVTYAFVRRFGDTLRGAMIVDVPIPGLAGWDEATAGFWHIGFIQAPDEIAEKLVVGRQSVFLGMNYDFANFSPEQRAYYIDAYARFVASIPRWPAVDVPSWVPAEARRYLLWQERMLRIKQPGDQEPPTKLLILRRLSAEAPAHMNKLHVGFSKKVDVPKAGLFIDDKVPRIPLSKVFDPKKHCFNPLNDITYKKARQLADVLYTLPARREHADGPQRQASAPASVAQSQTPRPGEGR